MTFHCTENLQSGVISEVRTRAVNTAVCPANHLDHHYALSCRLNYALSCRLTYALSCGLTYALSLRLLIRAWEVHPVYHSIV